jgi:hypothetical protein
METVSVTARMQPRRTAGPQGRLQREVEKPAGRADRDQHPQGGEEGDGDEVGADRVQVGGEAALEEQRGRQTRNTTSGSRCGASGRTWLRVMSIPPTTSATL